MAMTDDQVSIEPRVLFGRIEVDLWLEWSGHELIGMGRIRKYDGDGNCYEDRAEPTGVRAVLER